MKIWLDINLVHIKNNPEVVVKVIFHPSDSLNYVFFLAQNIIIINVSAIEALESLAHENVKLIKVETCKHLACEVSDRKTQTWLALEQRLAFGKQVKQFPVTVNLAVELWSMEDVLGDKPLQYFLVCSLISFDNELEKALKKDCLVDRHKERLEVKFAYPQLVLVSSVGKFHLLVKSLHAVQHTLFLPAVVVVCDEYAFEQRFKPLHYDMVYYTVAKRCCKDLPQLGLGNAEANACTYLVGPTIDFIA